MYLENIVPIRKKDYLVCNRILLPLSVVALIHFNLIAHFNIKLNLVKLCLLLLSQSLEEHVTNICQQFIYIVLSTLLWFMV